MKRIVSLMAVLGTVGFAGSAMAVGTAANTQIDNTANASFTIDGTPVTEPSDTVTFFVDEILDVDVTGGITELVGTDGDDDVDQVVSFTVTNTGNGPEDFNLDVDLGVAGDQFDPTNPASGTLVYLDDGDGIFDPLVDTPVNLANPLPLNADQEVTLFVVTDIPAGLTSGDEADVTLTATADTKVNPADATGTVYDNAGEGGVDAIVGTTGATDVDTDTYLVNQLVIDLAKEAEKIGGLGTLGLVDGTNVVQVPGDEIRYRLTFTVSGDGILDDVVISDAIPAGLNYDTGSIRVVVNAGAPASPSDSNADTDGGFKGAIPVGLPDAGSEGVVIDVEELLSLTELAVTTVPAVEYEIVIEFDVFIP